MTVWTKPVSWSKFRLALECPRQLQYTIDQTPVSITPPNYYAELGIIVQFVFEQYFNNGINLKPGGQDLKVLMKVRDRVLQSKWYADKVLSFPQGKTEKDLHEAIGVHLENGYKQFVKMKAIDKRVVCEQKWAATFHNMRMFGQMDFLIHGSKGTFLFDGKGYQEKNADPRQLWYYALILIASGYNVAGGGFLYWQHDFEKIDLSATALKRFIDGDFERGKKIFDRLKSGTDGLLATPTQTGCNFCSWRKVCDSSIYKLQHPETCTEEAVGFNPAPATV